MLAVANLRHTGDERKIQIQNFSIVNDDSSDGFSSENILDEIDFEDLFLDIGDGDGFPDLELDPDIFGDFIVPEVNSDANNLSTVEKEKPEANKDKKEQEEEEEEKGSSVTVEYESKRDESDISKVRKSTTPVKSSQGKRKVKVDWTPELHRRFVDAVEQLGLDKAVPSRILEIMDVDCLTRHNIASHLQKYRSHRKHLMAREAEAANWSQRRQVYGGFGRNKRDMRPLVVPTMAYPPPPPPPVHPIRPLHVWGHPTVDQGAIHVWPKHMMQSPSPLPWAPTPPPPDPFWHHHHRLPFTFMQGAPYYPHPMAATTRLRSTPATTVRGTPPPPPNVLYSNKPDNGVVFSSCQSEIQLDIHPSKETVDAAIGDVLTKPWLPLPLGLKPPSLDGVLVELQRQGISNIPLSSCF